MLLASCASGQSAARIAEPGIAPAYLSLSRRYDLGLDSIDGAAVVVAPGIAVTNAHNANLVPADRVIGTRRDYDLMFFRSDAGRPAAATAAPVIGAAVTAYGQGFGDLRIAHGVVRQIVTCPGCGVSAYFTFEGNAGPGFSGGPVVDSAGRLVGITFGYKDEGGKRLIYAYDMARVRAELDALTAAPKRA